MCDGSLTDAKKRAFAALLVARARLVRRIGREMLEAGVTPLEVYDALLALEDAPGCRLRLGELAERMVISPSGLTRMIDRLEAQGLVERQGCPKDRRARYAVLTDAGRRAREASWPKLSALIAEHFGEFLTDSEADQVAVILERMGDRR